ncbi:substrate-binding domain-containing protein [Psychromonas sp. Urea-02u-13]|uniref:substrate-binding domain-containing protein n=1 Tax=Psychromonas sp. Urea-02u-13 TaxID=2058326 RepID=UPI001E32D92B|nr:substrate-binding domain-containing protein [Psychromonas sp. Urea-02u-13]
MNAEQKAQRLKSKHWKKYLLSSLIPDNYWVGQQTAKALLEAGNHQAGDVMMISGDKTTPASKQRQAGATDYFNSKVHINLKYELYADWNQALSYQKSHVLIGRSKNLKYIWTANDLMAFGSIEALKELALKKPKEISVLGAGILRLRGGR